MISSSRSCPYRSSLSVVPLPRGGRRLDCGAARDRELRANGTRQAPARIILLLGCARLRIAEQRPSDGAATGRDGNRRGRALQISAGA